MKGPVSVFGYDYLEDKLGRDPARKLRLNLLGGQFAYEALNLVDGRRTLQEVRDLLSAIYGPVPLDLVAEYVETLEGIGVVSRVTE